MPQAVIEPKLRNKRLKMAFNPSKFLREILENLEDFESHLVNKKGSLKPIFTCKKVKNRLLRQVDPKDYVKFQTVWEGIKNLLNTLDKETDCKAIRADRLLLCEDLKKIKSFIYKKIDFDRACFVVEKNEFEEL